MSFSVKKLLNIFRHLEDRQIVFSLDINNRKTYAHLWNIVRENEHVKNDFMKQSTSLEITVLKILNSNRIIIVGNTHLYYHPEANHIRLLQIAMATLCLNNVKRRYQKVSMLLTP